MAIGEGQGRERCSDSRQESRAGRFQGQAARVHGTISFPGRYQSESPGQANHGDRERERERERTAGIGFVSHPPFNETIPLNPLASSQPS